MGMIMRILVVVMFVVKTTYNISYKLEITMLFNLMNIG